MINSLSSLRGNSDFIDEYISFALESWLPVNYHIWYFKCNCNIHQAGFLYSWKRSASYRLQITMTKTIKEIGAIAPCVCLGLGQKRYKSLQQQVAVGSTLHSTCWIDGKAANRDPTSANTVRRTTQTKLTDDHRQPGFDQRPTVRLVCHSPTYRQKYRVHRKYISVTGY